MQSQVWEVAAGTLLVGMCCGSLEAATIAYYRFEDIVDATSVISSPPASGTTLLGDQGNGGTTFSPSYSDAGVPSTTDNNKLRTWTDGGSAAASSQVPVAVVPQNGLANQRSMNFSGNKDIFTNDQGAQGSLGGGTYNSLTFEAYVRLDDYTQPYPFRSLFVVDDWGNANSHPEPTLALRFEDNGGLVAIANSQSGAYTNGPRFIATGPLNLTDGEWYHVALTIDAAANSMKIFVDGVEKASASDLTGGYLGNPNHNQFVLGRGFYNGGVVDSLNGRLDEVRFSDAALAPGEFLNAVPEPTSLFGCGALAMVVMRRRPRT